MHLQQYISFPSFVVFVTRMQVHRVPDYVLCYRASFDVLPAYVTDDPKNNTDLIIIRFRSVLQAHDFYYRSNIHLHLPFTFSQNLNSYTAQYLSPRINTKYWEWFTSVDSLDSVLEKHLRKNIKMVSRNPAEMLQILKVSKRN